MGLTRSSNPTIVVNSAVASVIAKIDCVVVILRTYTVYIHNSTRHIGMALPKGAAHREYANASTAHPCRYVGVIVSVLPSMLSAILVVILQLNLFTCSGARPGWFLWAVSVVESDSSQRCHWCVNVSSCICIACYGMHANGCWATCAYVETRYVPFCTFLGWRASGHNMRFFTQSYRYWYLLPCVREY
jgi:hypothetical protein